MLVVIEEINASGLTLHQDAPCLMEDSELDCTVVLVDFAATRRDTNRTVGELDNHHYSQRQEGRGQMLHMLSHCALEFTSMRSMMTSGFVNFASCI